MLRFPYSVCNSIARSWHSHFHTAHNLKNIISNCHSANNMRTCAAAPAVVRVAECARIRAATSGKPGLLRTLTSTKRSWMVIAMGSTWYSSCFLFSCLLSKSSATIEEHFTWQFSCWARWALRLLPLRFTFLLRASVQLVLILRRRCNHDNWAIW